MGLPTLRKCIDGTSARRVFSFIFRDRTLDLEFSTRRPLDAIWRPACKARRRGCPGATLALALVGGVSRRYKHHVLTTPLVRNSDSSLHTAREARLRAGADKAAYSSPRAFRAGWGLNPSSWRRGWRQNGRPRGIVALQRRRRPRAAAIPSVVAEIGPFPPCRARRGAVGAEHVEGLVQASTTSATSLLARRSSQSDTRRAAAPRPNP